MLILHVDDIAGHAVCVSALGGAIQDAIGRRCRHFLKLTNWIGPMLPRFVGHVQGRPWLRHCDKGDVCIVMLGEGKPVLESLRRQFRAVGCNQDMPVHRWTSSAPPIYHARKLPWHSRAVDGTPLGRKLAVETSVKDALLSPRASHRASGRSLSGGLPSRRLQSTLALISKLPSLDHDLFSAGVP